MSILPPGIGHPMQEHCSFLLVVEAKAVLHAHDARRLNGRPASIRLPHASIPSLAALGQPRIRFISVVTASHVAQCPPWRRRTTGGHARHLSGSIADALRAVWGRRPWKHRAAACRRRCHPFCTLWWVGGEQRSPDGPVRMWAVGWGAELVALPVIVASLWRADGRDRCGECRAVWRLAG